MKIYKLFALFLLMTALMAACIPPTLGSINETPADPTPVETIEPPTPVETGVPVPQAVLAAQKLLAERLGVDVDQVQIREIDETQWPDGCLGLPQAGEACTEALVGGFRVVLGVDDKTYEYRTNRDGSQIRAVEPDGEQVGGQTQVPDESNLPGAVLSARQVLVQQLGVSIDQVKIVRVEQVQWPNSCLGVLKPGQMCLQVITPGYRVIFEVEGKQYEYHTDKEGGSVVLAMAPLPQVTQTIIVWEQTEGGMCSRVEISQLAASFGACGETLMQGRLMPERLEELQVLVTTYAPFIGGTPAGTVDFKGEGEQVATEAEQRSIAEWARLVFQEAQSGRGGASWGMVFAWHQEGGIAGLCSDVTLYSTGWYYATSCRGDQPEDLGHFRLSADQLEQVYEWVDRYKGFEYEYTDPAVADAMTTRMIFSGAGQETAGEDVKQAILQFAAELYAQSPK